MIDLHLLLLPNAYCPPDGLAHESARPPGAHEDDVREVLQVEAHTPALYVDEENHVLAAEVALRVAQDGGHYMKGWYRTVADWNPLSHIVEGMQGFMNHDLSASQFAKSWLLPLVIAIISIAFSLRALSNRLAAS